jgi:hypothetical protein
LVVPLCALPCANSVVTQDPCGQWCIEALGWQGLAAVSGAVLFSSVPDSARVWVLPSESIRVQSFAGNQGHKTPDVKDRVCLDSRIYPPRWSAEKGGKESFKNGAWSTVIVRDIGWRVSSDKTQGNPSLSRADSQKLPVKSSESSKERAEHFEQEIESVVECFGFKCS